jgi:hypothetical protein
MKPCKNEVGDRERYLDTVDISGSRLLDVLHVSISWRLPEG